MNIIICHAFLEKNLALLSCQPSSSMRAGPPKISSRDTVKDEVDAVLVVEKLVVCEEVCVVVVLLTSDSRCQTNTSGAKLGKTYGCFRK